MLAILGKIFDKIAKSRAISGLDRLFGLLLGAIKGALVVSIVFVVAYLISPSIPAFGDCVNSLSTKRDLSGVNGFRYAFFS